MLKEHPVVKSVTFKKNSPTTYQNAIEFDRQHMIGRNTLEICTLALSLGMNERSPARLSSVICSKKMINIEEMLLSVVVALLKDK